MVLYLIDDNQWYPSTSRKTIQLRATIEDRAFALVLRYTLWRSGWEEVESRCGIVEACRSLLSRCAARSIFANLMPVGQAESWVEVAVPGDKFQNRMLLHDVCGRETCVGPVL